MPFLSRRQDLGAMEPRLRRLLHSCRRRGNLQSVARVPRQPLHPFAAGISLRGHSRLQSSRLSHDLFQHDPGCVFMDLRPRVGFAGSQRGCGGRSGFGIGCNSRPRALGRLQRCPCSESENAGPACFRNPARQLITPPISARAGLERRSPAWCRSPRRSINGAICAPGRGWPAVIVGLSSPPHRMTGRVHMGGRWGILNLNP